MKRFFQILDRDSSSSTRDYTRQQYEQGGGPASHSSGGSFIGKTFVIGQYHCTVEDVIAEGGFSLVFLVKANNGIRYALKRLYVNNEHDLNICKREIEIARKLGSHKNIVQMVESSINYCGNDVHEIFMLMQYCKGQLLHLMNDKINTGLTETEIIRILCDLCEAIGRMHHNDPPIIHRDLKIENILISDDGNYMLCDFGSATTRPLSLDNGQSALSIDEEIKRYTTLAYRSPEMVDVYSGKSINTKADIWALGCLLYKLCYFSLPFGESTLAIQNAQLTIPDSHSDRYSQRLSSLIAYMLTANPEKRPDIYQVSYLTFSLTGNECPLKNYNKSSIPSWSDLRAPPTESQARELKRIVPLSTNTNSSYQSTNVYQQANNLDAEKTTTTSVTPRQRPKASININSVLPTSPVAFQRSHTPSNNNNNTSEIASNLSVKDHHGLTNSHSFTSSSQLFSKTDQANNSNRAKNYPKAEKQLPTFASNPSLNKNNNENSFTSSTNHNPFLTSASAEETAGTGSGNGSHQSSSSSTTTAKDVPPPPPPRNQSLTFLENQTSNAETINPNIITNTTTTAPTTHQHRRNMSDSSAFSIKNQDNVKQKQQVGRGIMSTSNNLGSQLQSVSNEFMDGGGHQQSRNRSLNPFDDSIDDCSYEDQLFGKEFDKIRSETKHVKEADNNPFEAAPLNQERLKRFLDKKQQKQPSTTKIIITDNYEANQNEDSSNKKKQSTVITIKSDKEFTIVNNSLQEAKQKKLDPSDAADESGDQLSKMTSNKSISSSSQGGIATSPTTNYMPLYSSDTADDDDLDEYGIRLRNGRRKNPTSDDNDEDRGLTMSVNQDHIDLIPHYGTTGDMTEPLVEDDDDEEDDEDIEHEVIENPHSSIGSASDLITDSDDEDDDSQDNHDSSSNSSEFMELNDDNSSRHDSDNENEHEIRIKYGLVKNSSTSDQSMIQSTSTSNSKPLLNISKIQITSNKTINTINLQNIDDGTSISNSSMRSDSQKNIDSLDHLIGHVEGHRPLLEDEDEDDINLLNTTTAIASSSSSSIVTTKSLISMDQPPLIFDSDVSDSKYYHSKTASLPQVEKLNSFKTGDIYPPTSQVNTDFIPSHSSLNSIHSDFVSLSLTNQPMDETNEENRHLDEEVERSLQTQVIYDQKNNKDLFGSIPFTDKELINHSILQQESAAAAAAATTAVSVETKKPENTNRFENSFADLPVSGIKNSETLKEHQKTVDNMNAPLKSTDLFGAIPFSSSTQSTQNDTKTQIIKIPQPPQPTKNLLNKNNNLSSSSSMATAPVGATTSIQQTTKPLQPKFVQSLTKTIVSPGTSSQPVVPTATSPPPATATTLSNTGISKLSRNQFQRSNLKIKSKVAKKYEVDESDDEVDGLLDPLENDDLILDNDTVEPTLDFSLKKKKKDKKEKEKSEKKSKEPKVKEKKEEKKSKIKEKPDKAAEKIKNKEDKKKEKKEKEKKKDKKDKESKEKSKDKSSRKTSSEDPVSVVTGSQPITITSTDSVDSVTTKVDSKNKITSSSTTTSGTITLSKDGGKLKKSSSGTKQAFANMSFEDEIQHHNQQQRLSTSNPNNNVTITRC